MQVTADLDESPRRVHHRGVVRSNALLTYSRHKLNVVVRRIGAGRVHEKAGRAELSGGCLDVALRVRESAEDLADSVRQRRTLAFVCLRPAAPTRSALASVGWSTRARSSSRQAESHRSPSIRN